MGNFSSFNLSQLGKNCARILFRNILSLLSCFKGTVSCFPEQGGIYLFHGRRNTYCRYGKNVYIFCLVIKKTKLNGRNKKEEPQSHLAEEQHRTFCRLHTRYLVPYWHDCLLVICGHYSFNESAGTPLCLLINLNRF